MEVVLIIFLVFLVIVFLYSIFLLIKWVFSTKTRRIGAASLFGVLILVTIVNHIFFKKMQFIPSQVYSDLYLIKYPINNSDSLNQLIKNKVIQRINSQLISNEERPIPTINYTLRFYKYTKGWGSQPFGKAGTSHFIKNEEDPGGFGSELLEYYPNQQLASFSLSFCQKDSIHYVGNLNYYKDGEIVKTEMLINLCQKDK
ncbi:MAG: hypothetical protein R2753_15645 [Chitinophagales bacterium]